ncbi:MAG: response regulator transcription factor [Ilumatobacteraceae bacterium]|nr:response regulator transcription factor [Ilumatobacteraceae bacterium]
MSENAGMSAARLVVVEDDDSIRDLLGAGLRFAGYDLQTVANGVGALQLVTETRPDLIVLDVNLPDMDGFEVCRRLRAAGDDVPVIFLTARRDTDDMRAGYGEGGDDYVTKPFSLDELTFRIEAVLRRTGARTNGRIASQRLTCGHVALDEETHRAWSDGEEISLTPTEFRLLRYLLANVERVLTRMQILDHVWSYDFEGDWQIIETYVSSVRKKLETGTLPRIIFTVRGIGYSARRPAAV